MTRDLVSIDSEIYPSVIIFTPVSQFLVNLSFLGACSAKYLNSVLNVEALVCSLNQERGFLCDCEIFANLCWMLYCLARAKPVV